MLGLSVVTTGVRKWIPSHIVHPRQVAVAPDKPRGVEAREPRLLAGVEDEASHACAFSSTQKGTIRYSAVHHMGPTIRRAAAEVHLHASYDKTQSYSLLHLVYSLSSAVRTALVCIFVPSRGDLVVAL